MIRPSGWRTRTSRRRFNSKSVWLSSNKLLSERTRNRYVYSLSCFRWYADLISLLSTNLYYPLKSLSVRLKHISDDSLQKRKLRRTRRKQSRHYWTRRGWKLSCSRLLSLYRKYHLERVGPHYWVFGWQLTFRSQDSTAISKGRGSDADLQVLCVYFKNGHCEKGKLHCSRLEDQLTTREQV